MPGTDTHLTSRGNLNISCSLFLSCLLAVSISSPTSLPLRSPRCFPVVLHLFLPSNPSILIFCLRSLWIYFNLVLSVNRQRRSNLVPPETLELQIPFFVRGKKNPHQTVLKTYKTTKKTIKLQNNYINYKKLQ